MRSEADWPESARLEACRRAVIAAFSEGGALAGAIPGFRARASQREMALAVLETIARRGTLAAEAGTGTGKTLAYLVPAVLAGGKVLVSAATKALQDQIFDKDLPAVCRALSQRPAAVVLKGRQNYLCRLRLEHTAASGTLASREDAQALQRVVQFARVSTSGDRAELPSVAENSSLWPAVTSTRDNCLGAQCEHWDECFVVRARRRALAADIVVVNHHLLLADMALREDSDSELLPQADVVIVDEAHHLARVAGDFFGDGWSLAQVNDLGGDLLRAGLQSAPDGASWPELVRTLEAATREVRLQLAQAGAQRLVRSAYEPLARAPEVPASILALDSCLAAAERALAANAGRDAELDLLVPRIQRLRAALGPWAAPRPTSGGDEAVRWVLPGTHGAQFHVTPLSCASAFSQARFRREQAWILTSATLTAARRFDPFLEELGLGGATALRWDSPFDFAQQGRLYLPSPLPDPQAPDFPEQVAEAAWPVLCASRGRAFVLCSTLRAVERVARRLRERTRDSGEELRVLAQGESSRRALLADFRRGAGAILVGSVSFWEGIDVRGDALSVVVIDKLPFAPPDDPVVEGRIRHLKEQGRNPFRDFQLPQALTLLRQGAGRLIRDDADRGVLMILDERLLSRSYGKTMLDSLPPFTRTRSLEAVRDFLAAASAAGGAPQGPVPPKPVA